MADITVDVAGSSGEPTLHMHFPVAYHLFYLLDANPDRVVYPVPLDRGVMSAGIIGTVRGGAYFVTGLADGRVDLTIGISRNSPEDHSADFEDVVETSLEVDHSRTMIVGWGGLGQVNLPDLPAGPGSYRLRYHARGMDAAYDRTSETPIDVFLLQIWPAQIATTEYLKVNSSVARHWRNQ